MVPIIVGSAPAGPIRRLFGIVKRHAESSLSMSQPKSDFAKPAAEKAAAAIAQSPLGSLPPYARSLLRISVPVMVTLATTRLSLKRILQLGPGSIIPLDKSCEAPLTLQVGNHEL